jgi:hypothetical protein
VYIFTVMTLQLGQGVMGPVAAGAAAGGATVSGGFSPHAAVSTAPESRTAERTWIGYLLRM